MTLEQAANKIKFCVADSGMGIRPEDMGNLFKKFSRGSGTFLLHTEGTGLGLYVARMMIDSYAPGFHCPLHLLSARRSRGESIFTTDDIRKGQLDQDALRIPDYRPH